MEKNKLMRKALSLFMALVIIFGGAIPNAIPVHAAADLQIAQYVKVTGDTVCGGTETAKTAVYNGQWTASIPMGKVMSSME
ncbi:MAG: hypothetical protein PUI85_00125, partial [Eubacteriales bacterium]|nr:hypothetical protein [Eubacteriales bacterium]